VSGDQRVVQNSVPSFDLIVARYTSAGALDPTFGGGTGFVVHEGGGSESMWDMAVYLDGRIVVAGETSPPAGIDSFVARLLDDGTRDSTFNGDGLVSLAFSSATDQFEDVAIRPDAKIVAVGTAPTGTTRNPIDDVLVARYLGDSGSSSPMATLSTRNRL
jgi:uncharacterized delta-60 repeat protein